MYIDRLLNVDYIPMSSYGMESSTRNDLMKVPWEDSVKNFALDVYSFSGSKKFSVCVLLTQPGYKYVDATTELIGHRSVARGAQWCAYLRRILEAP